MKILLGGAMASPLPPPLQTVDIAVVKILKRKYGTICRSHLYVSLSVRNY